MPISWEQVTALANDELHAAGARNVINREPIGVGTEHDGIGFGQGLYSGDDIWRIADDRETLSTRGNPHFSGNDDARMDPDADGEIDVEGVLELKRQQFDFLDDVNGRKDRASRVVFMCGGISEVHQHPVAEVLSDVTFESLNDARRACLILQHDISEHFGIQLLGQARVVHHVDEHERDVAAFGVRRVAYPFGDGTRSDRNIRQLAPALTAKSHGGGIIEVTLRT